MELMHRHSAGLSVTLLYGTTNEEKQQTVEIVCETALARRSAVVPAERALDAFAHPCAYVDDANALFREPCEGLAETEIKTDDEPGLPAMI